MKTMRTTTIKLSKDAKARIAKVIGEELKTLGIDDWGVVIEKARRALYIFAFHSIGNGDNEDEIPDESIEDETARYYSAVFLTISYWLEEIANATPADFAEKIHEACLDSCDIEGLSGWLNLFFRRLVFLMETRGDSMGDKEKYLSCLASLITITEWVIKEINVSKQTIK